MAVQLSCTLSRAPQLPTYEFIQLLQTTIRSAAYLLNTRYGILILIRHPWVRLEKKATLAVVDMYGATPDLSNLLYTSVLWRKSHSCLQPLAFRAAFVCRIYLPQIPETTLHVYVVGAWAHKIKFVHQKLLNETCIKACNSVLHFAAI